jgi:deazaflavin-dependent oxidoreductase (nitroreductase family)
MAATSINPFDPRTGIRAFMAAHEFWYRTTNGLVGGWAGAPMLLLTTSGRKSGAARTTPLVFLRDGENLVVIASYGGSDTHPQWWLNLKANPAADVQVFAERRHVCAREAAGDERERLWSRVKAIYPIYRWYESRTSRQIPVVILEPSPEVREPAT